MGTRRFGGRFHIWEDGKGFMVEGGFEMDFDERVGCFLPTVEIMDYNYVWEICQAPWKTFKMPLYLVYI